MWLILILCSGLAHNSLSSRMVTGLLQLLCDNDTVTHLDLSSNEVDHSAATNELLRTFLICNVGMRSLNLCYNRLNTDSFKEIHLGGFVCLMYSYYKLTVFRRSVGELHDASAASGGQSLGGQIGHHLADPDQSEREQTAV
jgi:hypothetical protein